MSMVIPERTEHKYEPYPEYEDSGIEWLGQIPSHWDIRKLKQISSTKVSGVDKHSKEDEKPVYLCNYTDVYNKDTILPDNGFMEATATDNEIALFSLKKDDVIITKDSEDWRDIAVPSYISTNLPGVICGYHLALIRPELSNIIGRFLFWSFYARNINHQFTIASTGITRFGLGKYWLDNSLFFIPPIVEQQTIVDFLDRETAKIDELITMKQKLIELLQEQRIALITHAITKGINPDTPMKDSGIEWLGEIPAYWGVKKLKHLCSKSAIYGANEAANSYSETGIRFLRTSDIDDNGNLLNDSPVYIDPISVQDYRLINGDLLVSRSGTLGRSFLYDNKLHGECTYAGYLVRFVPNKKLVPKFAFYFTKSATFIDWLQVSVIQSTIGNVNGQKYANMPIPTPDVTEQKAIADFLDCETSRIDTLVSRINQAIEKLQEYRSTLITAAVTGKIDVRQQVS